SDRLRRWWESAPSRIRLLNSYGPTEATIVATAGELYRELSRVTIGTAVAGVRAYVLDRRGWPTPPGVAGELHLGGAGVARGYLERLGLTAERFIPDPYGGERGARLYRTGDRARRLPVGELEFLGRLDHQVKLRGLRIELGEVEAVLRAHPKVADAVVAVTGTPGVARLAAWVVPAAGTVPEGRELRSFAKEKMPFYMVPASVNLLPELPLLASGKADRRELARRAGDAAEPPERVPTLPRTAEQRRLTEIWSRILERGDFGVDDDFFELGGTSLLVVRLVFEARQAFAVELPLPRFFAAPTVAGMAAAIAALRHGAALVVGEDEPDLAAETVLDPAIAPAGAPGPMPENPVVLLTGATGFVGAFLLDELLRRGARELLCLVRAADAGAARERLSRNLARYGLLPGELDARIVPVPGDLCRPWLGLSKARFTDLARHVDVIYHAGAWVNFVYPYLQLRPANVDGTREVLRLACRERTKPLHHLSTFGVFDSPACRGAVREDDPLIEWRGLRGGYNRSKWVAEQLVLEARRRGLPASVYRFGTVSGHRRTGVGDAHSLFSQTIRSYLELAVAPRWDGLVELLPVDYLVGGIVHLATRNAADSSTFHLVNPQPLPFATLISHLRSRGHRIEQIPLAEWRATMLEQAERLVQAPHFLMLSGAEKETQRNLEVDWTNARQGLEGAELGSPRIDREVLDKYLSFLTDQPLIARGISSGHDSRAGNDGRGGAGA
ncbi:MAG: AMP-binding protein, partial [bacterium]|nr:AMP-binding protein [bacterium]